MVKILDANGIDWEDKYFHSQNSILFSKILDLGEWNSYLCHPLN